MENHKGQVVEYTVRKNGYSITVLASELKVNRRSIYNYFQNPSLKYDIICKIGLIVRHDFSKDFPELLTTKEFDIINRQTQRLITVGKTNANSELWKDKYIQLLEDYNEALRIRILNKIDEAQLVAS